MHFKALAQDSIEFMPFFLAKFGIYVLIGLIVGLCDRLISEQKKGGKWRININKLVFLGIPLTLYSLSYLIYYGDLNVYVISKLLRPIIYSGPELVAAVQSILGYVLITSFYKEEASPSIPARHN